MASTIRECVLKGVRFLNREYGKSWKKKINLKTLDLNSTCDCVLGQTLPYTGKPLLSSSYTAHRELLHLSSRQAYEYGFDAYVKYRPLTAAWEKELAK